MREIKFRAWYENVMRGKSVGDDIVWSKVSYYDYDPIIDNKGLCDVEAGWDIQGHENKNDYILEQYTGLKDKNGKEIYEGDIVKVGHLRPRFEVKYNIPCTKFWMQNNDLVEEFENWNEETGIEVIGNIHEHPELLGGEDE